jgi:hypothetical protein
MAPDATRGLGERRDNDRGRISREELETILRSFHAVAVDANMVNNRPVIHAAVATPNFMKRPS